MNIKELDYVYILTNPSFHENSHTIRDDYTSHGELECCMLL